MDNVCAYLKMLVVHCNSHSNQSTVKPVYNDHPWDQKKVVVVPRWSLFRGSICKNKIFLIKKTPIKTDGRLREKEALLIY